ncbi:MAG: META domain-containing protein [Nitrososphaerales archaeon]
MDRRLLLLIPIIIAGLLVALFVYPIGVSQDRTTQPLQLTAAEWSLQSLVNNGQTVTLLEGFEITIRFDEEEEVASGSGGCNSFFGEYEITIDSEISEVEDGVEVPIEVGGSLVLNNIAHTEIGCVEPGRMEQEGEFFSSLLEVTRFEVTVDGLKLFSQDEPSSIILSFIRE